MFSGEEGSEGLHANARPDWALSLSGRAPARSFVVQAWRCSAGFRLRALRARPSSCDLATLACFMDTGPAVLRLGLSPDIGHPRTPVWVVSVSGAALQGLFRRGLRGPQLQFSAGLRLLSLPGKARRKNSWLKICVGGPGFDVEPFGPGRLEIFKK